MGVSTEAAANLDLDAIVAGGDSFLARVKELKVAKDDMDTSFQNLKLGKDAAAAYADAQKNQQGAKLALDAAKEEAAQILADAHTQAGAVIAYAKETAAKVTADSETKLAAFNSEVEAGRKTLNDWSSQVTSTAKELQKAAQAKQAKADAAAAANEKRAAEISEIEKSLDAQIKASKTLETQYKAKLAAIMAAVS